jgi:hypothetical protein
VRVGAFAVADSVISAELRTALARPTNQGAVPTDTPSPKRFERPERIHFRLVRGPVPHIRESFILEDTDSGSTLTWEGELGTDFGRLGALWGDVVARSWDKAVRTSMKAIIRESERRSATDA